MDNSDLINLNGEKFKCRECENEVAVNINTPEGTKEASIDDINFIKDQLKQFPSKIIYGVCPVCGMEYVFKLVGEDLYLQQSDEEK